MLLTWWFCDAVLFGVLFLVWVVVVVAFFFFFNHMSVQLNFKLD